MPAEFAQMHGVLRQNLKQLLFGGDDFDQLAIVQNQCIAMTERDGGLQVNQHLPAMLQPQHLAAQMALVMGEDGYVPGRGGPFTGPVICSSVQHDQETSTQSGWSPGRIE
jgi:hypothetical protein